MSALRRESADDARLTLLADLLAERYPTAATVGREHRNATPSLQQVRRDALLRDAARDREPKTPKKPDPKCQWAACTYKATNVTDGYLMCSRHRAEADRQAGRRPNMAAADHTPQCGTAAGYRKHFRDVTEVCEPCLTAHREYRRALREKGRAT